MRRIAGRVAWVLAILVTLLVLNEFIGCAVDRGRWVCSICAAHERRTEWLGVTLSREPLRSDYHDWFTARMSLAHQHDWFRAGCHGRGGFIRMSILACSRDWERNGFFEFLPSWNDQEKAVRVAERLAGLDSTTRRREFDEADILRHPWLHSRQEFFPESEEAAKYKAWREAHPRWKDLLPE